MYEAKAMEEERMSEVKAILAWRCSCGKKVPIVKTGCECGTYRTLDMQELLNSGRAILGDPRFDIGYSWVAI